MIDGVIFDKDGTLFDFRSSWGAWTETMLGELATNPDTARRLGLVLGYDLATRQFLPGSPVVAMTTPEIADILHPHLTGIGICHFWRRRFDQAADTLEASLHELPSNAMTTWFLAACYAHMGRLTDARDFAASHGIVPGGQWLKIGLLYGDPEQRELLLSGLRLATAEQA